MSPVLLHLRLNHFPIVLILVAVAVGIVAVVTRRDGVWRYALVTVVLAAVTTPVVYWTGLRAEDIASEFELISSGDMEDHEDAAVWALVTLLAAGVAAGVALRKPATVTRWVALLLTCAAAGAGAWTGKTGGVIVHNADTEGWPPSMLSGGGGGGDRSADDDSDDHDSHDHGSGKDDAK